MDSTTPNSSSAIAFQQSAALLLALAVQEAIPGVIPIQAKITEDTFTYDFICSAQFGVQVDEKILPHIFQKMKVLQHQDLSFELKTMMRENAVQLFLHHGQQVQAGLVEAMRDNMVSICKVGRTYDLCSYEPLSTSKEISDFTLYEIQSKTLFYPTLGTVNVLRVQGAVFADKKKLKEFLKKQKIAKLNDPEKLCEELNLLIVKDRPFWLPEGMIVRDSIIQKWKRVCKKWGFEIVATPKIAECRTKRKKPASQTDDGQAPVFEMEEKLYSFSSLQTEHTELFTFALSRSEYRGPKRYAELTERETWLYTKDTEGLFLTKSVFCDCLHTFCKPQELGSELNSSLQFIQEIGRLFALDYSYAFFLPKERKEGKGVAKGQVEVFTQSLEKNSSVFETQVQKSAVLGPKIEAYATDARGVKWLVATVELVVTELKDEEGHEFLTISQSSFFSLERVVALLVEKSAGVLPLWLQSEQRELEQI